MPKKHHKRRRVQPRFELIHPVQIRCETWQTFIEVCTRNISQGGVFIAIDAPPALRSLVSLQINLPNETAIELMGRIAHIVAPGTDAKQPGIGIQFIDINENQAAVLRQLIRLAKQQLVTPPPPLPKNKL